MAIDVGVNKPAWLARCRDQVCGPLSLQQAKAAALAMAKGAAADYRIENPIEHLNGLAARLLKQRFLRAVRGRGNAGPNQPGRHPYPFGWLVKKRLGRFLVPSTKAARHFSCLQTAGKWHRA